MTTEIRPELSKTNKYYISKHRHYELKHFCLQYPDWKQNYDILGVPTVSTSVMDMVPNNSTYGDPTAEYAIRKEYYSERIKLIERIAKEADKYLHEYILLAVTKGRSYTYLRTVLDIPCGKDMYYDRYRKFFWLLDKARK